MEFGPAKVLGGMAKRTAEAKYAARDMVQSIERKYLAYVSDTKSLYFEYDAPTTTTEVHGAGSGQESQIMQGLPVQILPSKVPEATPLTQAIATASIADVPVSAREVIQALIAHKLKKSFKNIQTGKTIKELAGGMRSGHSFPIR